MNDMQLVLGGMAALAVLSVAIKVWAGIRRAKVAAEIARVGTSPVSLLWRVLVAAAVIAGVQWLVLTHFSSNMTLVWVTLGLPALVTAYALTRSLTVTEIDSHRRRGRR